MKRYVCKKRFLHEMYGNVEEGDVFERPEERYHFKEPGDMCILVCYTETKVRWMYITQKALDTHFEPL